ncbi:thioredoxin domain-containing protein [Pedobacter sp.]|nr:thioredoxin domain-containing protein [Candidatus Saccharibacteria bacterium]
MTPTRWIVFAVIVVVTLGGLVVLSSKDKIDVSSIDSNAVITTGANVDRTKGNADAKIVLVEYSDFQCPACAAAEPNIKAITETYKDEVLFVYRYFPLTTIHPNGLASASAAEAAGLQGKFWEMHDLLFQNQSSWESLKAEQRGAAFEGYATQLGLNIEQFNTDLASKKVADKINYDRAVGGKAGVNSTPTFFLDGKKVSDSDVEDVVQNDGAKLKELLNTAIKAAGGTVPTTTAN